MMGGAAGAVLVVEGAGARRAGQRGERPVDRGDPRHDLVMLVDLDVPAVWHRLPP
jgi:hypothetical protein